MFKNIVKKSFASKKFKNNIHKKNLLVILVILILNFTSVVYADDIDDLEIIDWSDEIVETTNTSEEPKINSRDAVIYDRKSQKIIWGKKENERRPMASTTKIMTAIVVLENANLSDTVTVSKKAGGTGGSRLGLKAGDKITVNNLLYGLLLVSGNDAAVALAEYVGGSVEGFANMMNKKASELGLENTHFVTPHGLDMQEHYTTAFELAKMADYALNIEKFAQIVNTKNITISISGRSKNLTNTNELLGNLNGVNGVKTGFTNGANRCLVTSVNRDGMNIITVVLGADTKKDRTNEDLLTQVILDLGFTLDLKIEEKSICNNKVYLVDENSLVACFDDEIDINIVDEICKYKPSKVVFKDSSFKYDNDKINLQERFKKLSPETEINIL